MSALVTYAGLVAALALASRATTPRVVVDTLPAPVKDSLSITSLHGAGGTAWAIGTYHGDGPVNVAVLLRFDGTAWQVAPRADGDGAMREVFAVAANDAWRVGAAGRYARWDGNHWTPGRLELAGVPNLTGSYFDLTGVVAWPGEAWISDASTGYFRWKDGTFAAETYGPSAKHHVHGPSGPRPDDVHALLDMGTVAHFDGTSWRDLPGPATDDSLVQLSPSRDGELWLLASHRGVFTKETHVFRRDGERWVETPVPTRKRVVHLAARGRGDAWAAAGDGVYRWDGQAWGAVPGVPRGEYGLVHADADGTVYAAGQIGARIVRIVPGR